MKTTKEVSSYINLHIKFYKLEQNINNDIYQFKTRLHN